MEIKPIAYIHTDFKHKFGIPRQSGRVAELTGKIVLEKKFQNSECLRGIEKFSHLWVIFGFHKAKYSDGTMTVRPPRLGGNRRVGIFASRSPFRPNSLGLSCVKLEKVEEGVLIVSGIDILDGTPIYDIKPYIPYSDSVPDACGSFAEEEKNHSLEVDFPEELQKAIPEDKIAPVIACLRDDPRPSYQEDNRVYSMEYGEFDVRSRVEDRKLTVIKIDNIKD